MVLLISMSGWHNSQTENNDRLFGSSSDAGFLPWSQPTILVAHFLQSSTRHVVSQELRAAKPEARGKPGNCTPKCSKTCFVVRYINKLQLFWFPEIVTISCNNFFPVWKNQLVVTCLMSSELWMQCWTVLTKVVRLMSSTEKREVTDIFFIIPKWFICPVEELCRAYRTWVLKLGACPSCSKRIAATYCWKAG